jgi:hypothetical protein
VGVRPIKRGNHTAPFFLVCLSDFQTKTWPAKEAGRMSFVSVTEKPGIRLTREGYRMLVAR